jgi:hypothetical protein
VSDSDFATVNYAACDSRRRYGWGECILLKNDDGPLPLGRNLAKIAVIGPHVDSTVVGFPQSAADGGTVLPSGEELGLEERAHLVHEGGEGGLVCLQDVVGAVEGDEPAAGHQCVKILGFGEGEGLVSATVENQGW